MERLDGWSERQSELDRPALPPLAWLGLGLWEAVGREEESMLSMLLHH